MIGIVDSTQQIVTSGLVTHYDAAQLRCYPGTGSSVTDLSGNGNNGTLINSMGFTTENGGAWVSTGNQYVQGNGAADRFVGGVMDTWYRNTGQVTGAFIRNWSWGSLWYENAEYPNGELRLVANTTSGLRGYGIGIGPQDVSIYNVVWKFEKIGTNLVVTGYRNGVKISETNSGNINLSSSPNTFTIPTNRASNLYCVKVYNRALSDAEVLQNYNAIKSRFNL